MLAMHALHIIMLLKDIIDNKQPDTWDPIPNPKKKRVVHKAEMRKVEEKTKLT